MVDEGHFPTPIHMRMACLFLSFPGPRSPNRGFLLRDSNEHHPFLALASCRFQIRARHFLFVLTFFEMYDRNLVRLGEPIDRLDVLLADLAKSSRRRNRE